MPDLKGAFEAKGFQSSQPPAAPHRGAEQRPPAGSPSGAQQSLRVPAGYPKYFKDDGQGKPCLDPDYVSDLAENIAHQLKNASPKLTRHQLRAFYDHLKRQAARVEDGCNFEQVAAEVAKMQAIATSRALKNPATVSPQFVDFISRNVKAIQNGRDLRDGFVKHFEAVVAFCADIRD